jgi:hypothetical protein
MRWDSWRKTERNCRIADAISQPAETIAAAIKKSENSTELICIYGPHLVGLFVGGFLDRLGKFSFGYDVHFHSFISTHGNVTAAFWAEWVCVFP